MKKKKVVVADKVGLKPRNHVLPYLIVYVESESLCHDSIIWSSGNYKLKGVS